MAEYDSKTKAGKCIFCEIATGRLAPMGNGTFYDDGKYMAFLSPFPNTTGFTVVIPKQHFASDVLAMPDADLADFVVASKKVARILEGYFPSVGRVGLIMEGTGINHAHIKLVPFQGTPLLKNGGWQQFASGVDTFFETYPGYICSNDSKRVSDEEISGLARKLREFSAQVK